MKTLKDNINMYCATYEHDISSNSRHYIFFESTVCTCTVLEKVIGQRNVLTQALYGVQKRFKACNSYLLVCLTMCIGYRPIKDR